MAKKKQTKKWDGKDVSGRIAELRKKCMACPAFTGKIPPDECAENCTTSNELNELIARINPARIYPQ